MPDTDNAAAVSPIATEVAGASAVQVSEPAPQVDEKGWSRVLIVAAGTIKSPGNRNVIVAEYRAPPKIEGPEDNQVATQGELKTSGYPKDADAYYRTDDAVTFPEGAPVYTLGANIRPAGVGGFARRGLSTGPGLSAYAAANLAWQLGAKDIEISGLTKAEQAQMQPWLDSHKMPDDVKIHFSA